MPKANRNQSDSVALEVQTGKSDAEAAAQEGIQLEVVKHREAKHGLCSCPAVGGRTILRLGSTIQTPGAGL